MSQHIARQVLSRINMAGSLFSPVADFAGDLMQLAQSDTTKEMARVAEARAELCAAYGFEASETRKPFAFAGGVAIIPVHGSLINRFGQSWSYVTGYNFIRSQLASARADADVTAIILDCNSYGGEVAGCFETANEVYAARGDKPIIAVIDSNCHSACYAIASAADRMIITPTGSTGSIGALAMHVSMKKMLDQWGFEVTLIYAGAHKVDGNPFESLPDSVRADIQRGVDASRDTFVSLVARNRGLDEAAVRGTEARIYRAEDALSLRLVDQVATPQEAVAIVLSELSGSTETQENDMSQNNSAAAPGATTTQAAAPAAPAAAPVDTANAAQLERERCSAIINCEAGKANPTLANHIAFNTQLGVEEAKQMLSAAAPATTAAAPAADPVAPAAPVAAAPAAPVAGAQAAAPAVNPFKETMDADKHPEVGPDGGAQQETASGKGRVAEILGAFKAATGQDLR